MAKAIIVTIPAGEFISSSADLTNSTLSMIMSPSGWTAANLSFLVSDDNTTFYDLIDDQGREILRPIKADCATLVPAVITQGAMHVRIRSGSRDGPIAQEADRVFKLITV
jgi:hypothetical protein